jgi:hypothetical protein
MGKLKRRLLRQGRTLKGCFVSANHQADIIEQSNKNNIDNINSYSKNPITSLARAPTDGNSACSSTAELNAVTTTSTTVTAPELAGIDIFSDNFFDSDDFVDAVTLRTFTMSMTIRKTQYQLMIVQPTTNNNMLRIVASTPN